MAEIKRVVVAGYGRFGSVVVSELLEAGFQTTIFTRSKLGLKDVPSGVQIREVNYDSKESLKSALDGQDAVVSTVAMSALGNQKILIDAAIAAGVKHFIPAEFTIESRHPEARGLPMLASVVDIQDYLTARQDKINWNVVSPGATIEFVFDVPFIIDFDKQTAVLWDGGKGTLSIGSIPITAKAVAGALKQPSRIQDHCVHVHGAVVSQEQVLRIAEKFSSGKWTTEHRDAAAAVKECEDRLKNGIDGQPLQPDQTLQTIITMYSAKAFGRGFFDGAYQTPDNVWLGIDERMDDKIIEEAIRYRIEKGKLGHAQGETPADVVNEVMNTSQRR